MSTTASESSAPPTSPAEQPETRRELAPSGPRTPRELANLLWTGWPFGEGTWAWPEPTPAGVPVRIEELVQNGQVVVRAELPGLDPEKDIEVVVEDDILTIKAERRESAEDRTSTGYRSEFRYGSFVREVRLPKGTTAEVVSATYRDGVLEVRMPAPGPRAAARRIDIDRG